uniref:histidine kinase n=1 Tax=Magnetococcus massalia (strain MO-1) TaxID=451514 RepID=A0A1S7LEF9_MAGMO|nr:putative Histidine kinase [Candidatus Magnetococcus massalia]
MTGERKRAGHSEGSDYTWARAAGFSIRVVNRDLMEKALYMRAQSYLSQIRSQMLSETLYEIDRRRRRTDDHVQELSKQKERAEAQKMRLESANAELEKRVMERTRELRVHKERAERASMAKSRFLSMVSHELLTPLNTIQGMADLMAEQSCSDQQSAWVGAQKKSCRALLEVIESILLFTDDAELRQQDRAVHFAPADVLQQIIKDFSPRAAEKGLTFHTELAGYFPDAIIGDHRALYIILKSLISNAIKFTERGEVTLSANWQKSEGEQGALSFTVEDTGIGLDAAQMASLFQPLQQLESGLTRTFQGLGMGLSLCRSLIERQDGVIVAESEPKQGSLFRVSMPYDLATPKEAVVKREVKKPTAEKPVTDQTLTLEALDRETMPTVLLVDDAKENIFLMKAFLSKFPCKLTLAFNGQEAVNRVQEGPFDLILMDVQMPVMDGLTAMREIRRLEKEKLWPREVILVVSAHGLEQDREEGFAAGCDDYLTKPIRKKTLIENMQKWLKLSKQQSPL